MEKVLLVSSAKASLSNLASALEKNKDVEVSWAASGSHALECISGAAFDLVITEEILEDMTGLELADRLLRVNPLIHCASVSTLQSEEYHKKSEGLGLMNPLPDRPGEEDAERLLQDLRRIKRHLSGG